MTKLVNAIFYNKQEFLKKKKKMKNYPFSVLLIDEANKTLFPVKEDIITIISLENGKVTDIKYVKTAAELGEILK